MTRYFPALVACCLGFLGLGLTGAQSPPQDDPFSAEANEMRAKETAWKDAHTQLVATIDSDMCSPGFRNSVKDLQTMSRDAFQAKNGYYMQWYRLISGRVADIQRMEQAIPMEVARLRKDRERIQRELADASRRRAALRGQTNALAALDALSATLRAETQEIDARITQLIKSGETERQLSRGEIKQLELLNKKLAESALVQLRAWDNLYATFIDRSRIRCP